MAGFPRLRAAYASLGVLVLHVLLLFALVNAAAFVGVRVARRLRDEPGQLAGVAARYGLERLARAHPELSRDELLAFLAEKSRSETLEYAPFTEFRQRPTSGRFINVSPAGYRHVKGQGPWPPDRAAFNLFVLGGSTAFGDGLPDEHTIPSVLQEILAAKTPAGSRPVRVYDFACPGYFSSQERVLLSQLLVSGYPIDAAVFLDGLNEFHFTDADAAPYLWQASRTKTLRALVEDANRPSSLARLTALLRDLPVSRLSRELSGPASPGDETEPAWTASAVAAAASRWQSNVKAATAIGAAWNVPTLFVWQPVPVYEYDLDQHLFHDARFPALRGLRAGYGLMASRRTAGDLPENVLWLADLQAGRRVNLYVDAVHYDAAFSREIAGSIAAALRARRLVP